MPSSAVDFLPVCDLLFNFISVATYFCDVAFDVIVAYTAFQFQDHTWFYFFFFVLVFSVFLCHVISIKWYVEEDEAHRGLSTAFVLTVHFALCGVFWRYGRLLFAPIDIGVVKREMSCLSVIRMVHAFVQCVPSLLAKGYLIAILSNEGSPQPEGQMQILYVSSALSLFSICWGLASFNKNIRPKTMHRLILTWIGVISQFLWRLGMVSARMACLVLYASVYHAWVLVFGFLHWLCMFLWLLFMKKNEISLKRGSATDQSEPSGKQAQIKATASCLLLSFVYMVDFLNMDSTPTAIRMALFYVIILIENLLLFSLWCAHIQTTLLFSVEDRIRTFFSTMAPFSAGIAFMILYYKVFHVSKTKHPGDSEEPASNSGKSNYRRGCGLPSASAGDTVFNCALNPALRKKKKIPRVIPPPPGGGSSDRNQHSQESEKHAFWKDPLPLSSGVYDGSPEVPALSSIGNERFDSSGEHGDIDSTEEHDWSYHPPKRKVLSHHQHQLSSIPSIIRNGVTTETPL